jgi:hypothetical protein
VFVSAVGVLLLWMKGVGMCWVLLVVAHVVDEENGNCHRGVDPGLPFDHHSRVALEPVLLLRRRQSRYVSSVHAVVGPKKKSGLSGALVGPLAPDSTLEGNFATTRKQRSWLVMGIIGI